MSPLTPAECDLSDFQFMPLDVARLRDSELASNETPEACWAAVLLWAASWHQIPAASVPDDDRWLAKAAGYVARGKTDPQWAKIREGAMRGFVRCDDGRLYHPVVAEKAREAWQAKLAQRWRTECARIKKHNERHHTEIEKPSFESWMAAGCPQGQPLPVTGDNGPRPPKVTDDNGSKGQGEGQGQGHLGSVPKGTGGTPPPDDDKPDPKREIYTAGKSLLHVQGMPKAQCGSFITKLCTDYGNDIALEAVRSAVSTQPLEAAAYLKATCQRLKGERRDPVTVASDAAAATVAELAKLAAHAERAASPEAQAARLAAVNRVRAAA
jgi:hypothetical protein